MKSPISRPLPHFNERPSGAAVDTFVIHSMFAEGPDPFDMERCIALLDHNKVASHYAIGRDGTLVCFVPEAMRAWHAGVSCLPDDGRENVNDFSVGVELVGTKDSGYTDMQYQALVDLTAALAHRHPLKFVVGHTYIAPTRKTDPDQFDWERFKVLLFSLHPNLSSLRFQP